ncbi:alpha1,2-mannosidase subfamily protein [Pelomyxa schiedti]|nr:alpha1,2-mannosidase subfamily protein [Pelomyxa schiedti]
MTVRWVVVLTGIVAVVAVGIDPLTYVNTLIGTYGTGYGIGALPPGPQTPFGLVRLGPDTCEMDNFNVVWRHNGGYYWGDNYIRIFSHTHLVGAGLPDYGSIGVMPMNRLPTSDDLTRFGFRSNFSHSSETIEPGYYSVTLEDPNIKVELTATDYVGLHRYSYLGDSTTERVVLFDTTYTLSEDAWSDNTCGDTETFIDPLNNEISGWIQEIGELSGRYGGFTTYFVAQSNLPFELYGVWDGNQVLEGATYTSGCGRQQLNSSGAYIVFPKDVSTVEIYVGISSISIEQARLNLKQINGLSFDSALDQTQGVWRDYLNMFEVDGTHTNKIKFYTALYHTLLAPTTFSEEGGNYIGFDKSLHQLPSGQDRFLSDMSIWDTFRTEAPWLTLVAPDVARDSVRSLTLMYQQGGSLPRWPMAYGYTGCMCGTHAIIVIVDAWKKGVQDFDVEATYAAMKYAATETQQYDSRVDINDWINLGYIPGDVKDVGCVLTQDYSYDDWALGSFAADIGEAEDATTFTNRSKNYKNVWNPETMFFCPKSTNGIWDCPKYDWQYLDPADSRYVEGDAWHYRFYAPWDPEGLIALFGSTEVFAEQLDIFMESSKSDPVHTAPNPYYWAGNEHNIQYPYLFNFANRTDLTQKHVRWLLDHRFTAYPEGIPGNDDYGTMSAWFTFGALGFFPIAGSSTYLLGSPLFDKVVFHRPDGGLLTITANDNSDTNVYVSQVYINGVLWNEPTFDHADLYAQTESTIEFYMSSTPNAH